VLGGIPQFVADNMGFVFSPLATAFDDLVGLLSPYWDAFAGWFGAVLQGIPQFVADNMGDVFNAITTAFNDLVPVLAPLWDAFAGWFQSVLAGLPQFVIDNAGDIFGGIVQAATDLVGRIATAIDPIRTLISDTFGALGSWVSSGSTPGATTQPDTGGGTVGSLSPLITIGTLIVSSEQDAVAFLQLVAETVLASSRRVQVPAAGGNPALG
jgi:phage-related minor tail protein